MIKVFLVSFFLIINIQARENPFFPSQGEEDLPVTSNQEESIEQLTRASLTLPSTARVIKKVTVEYENIDASVKTKSIDLDNAVDWHLPIFISQSYTQEEVQKENPKNTKKPKKVKTQNEPSVKIQMNEDAFNRVGEIKYAKFFLSKKSLKIITKDKLLRNFLLGKPHRIVMDFKRDSSIKSYIKNIPQSVFTKIRVGNHDGYYRIVLELDGYYRYTLKKQADGCLIRLK